MYKEYEPLGVSNFSLILPADLVTRLEKTRQIFRFADGRYPDGSIINTVYEHTISCVRIARNLDIGGINQNKLIRILWIHDIPEILSDDVNELDRASMGRDGRKALVASEEAAARQLLNISDFELWQDFDRAEDFMRGNSDEVNFSPEALFAFIIEKVEGNLMFHFAMSLWFSEDNNSTQTDVLSSPFSYTRKQYEDFKERLQALDYEKYKIQDLQMILDMQIDQVKDWWKRVDNVPPAISDLLLVP